MLLLRRFLRDFHGEAPAPVTAAAASAMSFFAPSVDIMFLPR